MYQPDNGDAPSSEIEEKLSRLTIYIIYINKEINFWNHATFSATFFSYSVKSPPPPQKWLQ